MLALDLIRRIRGKIRDLLWRRWGLIGEATKSFFIIPKEHKAFVVVSSEYNAGDAALKCLDSIYRQKYPRSQVKHVFIDDASTDATHEMIVEWLEKHPGHNVEYIRNNKRLGGTVNNLLGFRKVRPGSIVLELNGDDWLPNNRLMRFLNKVYANDNIWMTYNTFKIVTDGKFVRISDMGPAPDIVIKNNSIREYPWTTSHLHTFKAELFFHVKEESLIDPETGEYWAKADDMALYLSMSELAGRHSKHIYRVTYIYNLRDLSEENIDREGQRERERRIRKLEKYEPLEKLQNMLLHEPNNKIR